MAQQNEKQPKAKTGLARCLELASGHKGLVFGAARIKQHKNVFRKRRSFGYAVSPFCRSISKDAGSIPTRS